MPFVHLDGYCRVVVAVAKTIDVPRTNELPFIVFGDLVNMDSCDHCVLAVVQVMKRNFPVFLAGDGWVEATRAFCRPLTNYATITLIQVLKGFTFLGIACCVECITYFNLTADVCCVTSFECLCCKFCDRMGRIWGMTCRGRLNARSISTGA